ncbi:hypothetical protein SBC2_78570 (plasmid) [Caballeronia sp. SBC2]|nr:hypothetical protein SBC2_78570 [Caballeronia sp. SBC2]
MIRPSGVVLSASTLSGCGSKMPSACEEFAKLVLAQAQHNVDASQTSDSKAKNQGILESLNNALKQEANLTPPKTYDAGACKIAVANWKTDAADGPCNTRSAEAIAQQNPADQSTMAAPLVVSPTKAASSAAPKVTNATAPAATTAATGTQVLALPATADELSASAQQSPASAPIAPPSMGAVESAASTASAATASSMQVSCDTALLCAKDMLNFARSENLAGAMQAASAIDALAKPARGDRANARKLNQMGLAAFSESKTDDAVHLLEQANRLDPGDEEIISNLAYAYAMNGQLAQSEDTAVLALALNPRRTSIWAPLAVTLQEEKRPDQAIEAMWLAYQFSADKQKTLAFIDSHITSERDPDVKSLYERSKAWFVENQKPSLNTQG